MVLPKSTRARWAGRFPTSTSRRRRGPSKCSHAPDSGHTSIRHLLTVARLHRENRFDRVTTTVEDVTGQPAESFEEFITRQKDLFSV